jgi:hypothetical protein
MIKICDHCGDTPLDDEGKCPVCSQQVVERWEAASYMPAHSFPLCILRGGHFRMRRGRNGPRGGSPRGKWKVCAVIDQTDKYPYGEYLTACGDVVQQGCSVWSEPPNCPECRRALRANIKGD